MALTRIVQTQDGTKDSKICAWDKLSEKRQLYSQGEFTCYILPSTSGDSTCDIISSFVAWQKHNTTNRLAIP